MSHRPDARRLYRDLAWTWPIISPPEDYVEETREYRRLFRAHAGFPVRTVFHLGCGGGHIDATLKRWYRVTGVDISPPMLRLARRLNPDVEYIRGDMRTVRLGRVFDAVLLADSVDYMTTDAALRAAFATALLHLRPGGAFITCAELAPSWFRQDETIATAGRRGTTEIVLIENRYDPDPGDTWIEATFVYLIRRNGRLTVETDSHRLGIFPLATWSRLLASVGFVVTRADGPRGAPSTPPSATFVGVRPTYPGRVDVPPARLRDAVRQGRGTLRKFGFECSATVGDLRRWFSADTAYPDVSLREVLDHPLLVVHELVEIDEVKRQGLQLTKDVIVAHPDEVDAAHVRATEVEVRIAAALGNRRHLASRAKDIARWIDDPIVPREHRTRYRHLLADTRRRLQGLGR